MSLATRTEKSTTATGTETSDLDKALSGIVKGTSMKEVGLMIRERGKGSTTMQTATNTEVSSTRIRPKERVLSPG